MTALTPRQIQILRWLDENPSHKAGWTIDGRQPKSGESHKLWNVMVVEGKNGSIHIALADSKALYSYITGCPTPDKIYGPNEAGKAALAAVKTAA